MGFVSVLIVRGCFRVADISRQASSLALADCLSENICNTLEQVSRKSFDTQLFRTQEVLTVRRYTVLYTGVR